MKNKVLALALIAGGTLFAADFNVGIRVGPPPPPRIVRMQPRAPGPGFVWVQGYWYPVGNRYRWHDGYWTRPPYEGANWIGPRYEGGQFFEGRWGGPRGERGHDHAWDRDRRERDYRGRDRDDRR